MLILLSNNFMAKYKLKSKSAAKKRFSLTANGKVKCRHAKKRHNARKLSSRSNRDLRAPLIAAHGDSKIIKRYLLS
jgi:large subunit ribosomal protein L35